MEEMIDILNEKGEKSGESKTHNDVHHEGLIHLAVHVWLLNSKGQILLQKRSKNKIAYPGYWDISAAGHVSAGQSSLEAAQRETEEELGLFLSPDNFKHLFSLEQHIVLNEGTYINNEFNDVYIIYSDFSLSEFKLQDDEVEEVRWIGREELIEWINGKGEPLVPHKEEYKKLLEYLTTI